MSAKSGFRGLVVGVAAALVVGIGGGAARGADVTALPTLADAGGINFNSLEERRLGRQFMRSALVTMPFSDDAETVRYIRTLGSRLLSGAGLPESEFQFNVVNEPSLNAFAVPGGYIAVHSGLILATATEDELASVMAHEIAHITQRHIPRMIARAQERSLPAVAAMVAAILVGGQVGSAALIGANAAVAADQLKYSRDFEKEADSVGVRILAAASYEPRAMPAFFEKLEKGSSLQGVEVPEYLRTHPLSVGRIADSEARAASYPAVDSRSSLDYYLVRARVRVLVADDPKAARRFFEEQTPESADHALALRYGAALAAAAAGDAVRAYAEFDALAAEKPGVALFGLAAGQSALARGDVGRAVEIFADSYFESPEDATRARYYAEALIAAGQFAEARKVVRRWQRQAPADAAMFSLLSRVEGETGRLAESFQARAEYFALRFDIARALEELQQARRHVGDSYYLQQSIDARVAELREEQSRLDQG